MSSSSGARPTLPNATEISGRDSKAIRTDIPTWMKESKSDTASPRGTLAVDPVR